LSEFQNDEKHCEVHEDIKDLLESSSYTSYKQFNSYTSLNLTDGDLESPVNKRNDIDCFKAENNNKKVIFKEESHLQRDSLVNQDKDINTNKIIVKDQSKITNEISINQQLADGSKEINQIDIHNENNNNIISKRLSVFKPGKETQELIE